MRAGRIACIVTTVVLLCAGLAGCGGSSRAADPSTDAPGPGSSGTATPPSAFRQGRRGVPTAQQFSGSAVVGALFSGAVSGVHGCVGTTVASTHGNTVLTAAHCLRRDPRGEHYAPGYHRGHMPYGVWTVTGVQFAPAWTAHRDPHDDVAIVTVADRTIDGRRRTLQQVTGAARLGSAPRSGSAVTVVGYNRGSNDNPLRCAVTVRIRNGYPAIACQSYGSGSSGSPWLAQFRSKTPTLVAAISGRNNGGCTASVSYSAPFGSQVRALLRAAEAGQASDHGPKSGSDGC